MFAVRTATFTWCHTNRYPRRVTRTGLTGSRRQTHRGDRDRGRRYSGVCVDHAGSRRASHEQYARGGRAKQFSENVTLISSVSGGATGSMFYLSLYDSALPQHFHSEQLPASLTWPPSQPGRCRLGPRISRHSSGVFSRPANLSDRGFVLEETWRNRAHLDATLSQWRAGSGEGWRPATIFNSTVDETGEPLLFQPLGFPMRPLDKHCRVGSQP